VKFKDRVISQGKAIKQNRCVGDFYMAGVLTKYSSFVPKNYKYSFEHFST